MNINIQGFKRYRLYCFMWGYYRARGHYQIAEVYKGLVEDMETRSGWKGLEEQLEGENLEYKNLNEAKEAVGERS